MHLLGAPQRLLLPPPSAPVFMPPGANPSRSYASSPSVWFSVTVRVAWDLMLAGVRVRPALLADAREHVLTCLPEGVGADEAEDLAGPATLDFLGRVRDGHYDRLPEMPDTDLTICRSWRDQLFSAVDPVGDAVLRLHYGDGMDMAAVERTAAIDGSILSGAREGIREAVRSIVDGQGVESWVDERMDRLIRRIVSVPAPDCPPPTHLLSDTVRDHVDSCPRCSRAVRLIRGGLIAPLDLLAPGGDAPASSVKVLAILLHPDARKYRRKVIRALGESAIMVGQDAWLMDRSELVHVAPKLRSLAEESQPPRHHLRGAVVTGEGRWSGPVLLGPAAIQALDTARSRPWSEIDQLGELPPPRPPAPKATRWWMGVAVSAIAAGLAGYQVLQEEEAPPSTPIAVDFRRIDSSWVIRFDTEDLAVVDVVGVSDEGLSLLHAGARSEKGRWATGEGDFQIVVPGVEVALIASEAGIPELYGLVEQARSQSQPMRALEGWVRTTHPTVDFVVSPAIIEGVEPAVLQAEPPPIAN